MTSVRGTEERGWRLLKAGRFRFRERIHNTPASHATDPTTTAILIAFPEGKCEEPLPVPLELKAEPEALGGGAGMCSSSKI